MHHSQPSHPLKALHFASSAPRHRLDGHFLPDACRLFHGRGGLYPGCEQWSLDWYPPVLVLTSFNPVSEDELATIGAALSARWHTLSPGQALNWVFQCRAEGLADTQADGGDGA